MAVKIAPKDYELVVAFLLREALDFRSNPLQQLQFSKERLRVIEQSLLEHDACNHLWFTSISNAGLVCRQLLIDPAKIVFEAHDLEVVLCTCGRISCWGEIRTKPSQTFGLYKAPGS